MEEICNICMSPVEGEIVRLQCNDTHYFCNDCIVDWYKELKSKKYKYMYKKDYEFRVRMCPICREDGGLLPLFKQEEYIPSIHHKNLYKKKKVKKGKKKEDVEVKKRLCGFEIGNGRSCSRLANEKYDWRCFQHGKKEEKKEKVEMDIEDEIEEMVNPVDETLYEEDLEGVMQNIEDEWIHAMYELNELEEKIDSGEIEKSDETKVLIHSFLDFVHLYKNEIVQNLLRDRIKNLENKI